MVPVKVTSRNYCVVDFLFSFERVWVCRPFSCEVTLSHKVVYLLRFPSHVVSRLGLDILCDGRSNMEIKIGYSHNVALLGVVFSV